MGQRTQAAAGCLSTLVGLGAGIAVWNVRADGRVHRFEQGPDWRVFYVDLPLCLGGGALAGALAGVLLTRLITARRADPPTPG
ncbi:MULTISPECIES: hypothetical protein [unclassified Streptomyces]|uniref:hypothetical protein n=1 Tax=unclassified Streptomyces TaxID=2593676 RepID=UPI002E179C40|nr:MULTISPECIES: hypothetical protein [unclassified Streptomyces]